MLDDLDDIHPLFAGAPTSTEFKKLRKRIVREVREAIETYGMIERGAERTAIPFLRSCTSCSGAACCPSIFWPATSTRVSRGFRRRSCQSS